MKFAENIRYFIAALLLLLVMSCKNSGVSAGLIVRNDIQDTSYNSFVVTDLVTSQGRQSYRKILSPGEEVMLPYRHILSFTITRQYEDFDRIYRVKCPKTVNPKTIIKLIDVHTNRIQGGCWLSKKGKKAHGSYIKWD